MRYASKVSGPVLQMMFPIKTIQLDPKSQCNPFYFLNNCFICSAYIIYALPMHQYLSHFFQMRIHFFKCMHTC